jgi:hypothetical protein
LLNYGATGGVLISWSQGVSQFRYIKPASPTRRHIRGASLVGSGRDRSVR